MDAEPSFPHAADGDDDEVYSGSTTMSPLSLTSPRAGSGSGGAHDDSSSPTTWHGLSDADAIAPPTSTHLLDAGASLLGSPVSDRWFMFGDARQARCPALLAAACAVVLDATRPDGFAMVGPEGDVFAVSSDIGGAGSDPAGGAREISWRVVLFIDPNAAGVLPLPDGPYLVHSTRRGGRWCVFVRTSPDEASGVRVYVVGTRSREDLADSLHIAVDTTDDGGEDGLARTWRVMVESGLDGDTGSWRTTVHTGGRATATASHEHVSRPISGVIRSSSSSSHSRSRSSEGSSSGQHQRQSRWDQPPPPPCCSGCGTTHRVEWIMTCCHRLLCVGCAEVNPCGCPEWQNRRGFAVPILPQLALEEECVVEGAIVPQLPRWQIFYARHTGSEVYHAFFRVQDVIHDRGSVLCQLLFYEMDGDSRRWHQVRFKIVELPSRYTWMRFPPMTEEDTLAFEFLVIQYRHRRRQ
uniref:Uncharacterized protein n=1 Tax=Oryza barthii TaxID=65489 RepID=A0A0D3G2K1_9ORYZ